MRQYDVLIVGGGIAGAALAAALAYSTDVVLVERDGAPGREATGSATGILNETLYDPLVAGLTTGSRGFFDEPAPGQAAGLTSARPLLAIARAQDLDVLDSFLAAARHRVPDAERLLGPECEAVCPVLRPGVVAGGLLEPRALQLDFASLHTSFVRTLLARGGDLRMSAHVVTMERERGRWLVLCADGSVLAARTVVNAAGAWADQVADLAGARPVGLRSLSRTQFVAGTARGGHSHLPLVVDVGQEFYFRAFDDSVLVSPMDEVPAGSGAPAASRTEIERAVRALRETTTLEITQVTSAWAGARTFAPDRRPVVGFDPVVEGFFWFAGLGDYGFQVAPALARAGACLLREVPFPADLLEMGVHPDLLAPGRQAVAV